MAIQQIRDAGFTTKLWNPPFGWTPKDAFASQSPFPLQAKAALQIFQNFFLNHHTWVHLQAPMQAGKTGAINTLIRLILANHHQLHFTPDRIFVLSGMADDSWKSQTKLRVPARHGVVVQHNANFDKVAITLRKLATGDYLRNILIVIDESHYASAHKNRLNHFIYSTIKELAPADRWAELNIRFLTVSATDPAKTFLIPTLPDASLVTLQTTSDYQSIQDLYQQRRLGWLETRGSLATSPEVYDNLLQLLQSKFTEPKYHILRPTRKGFQYACDYLSQKGYNVIPWHSQATKEITLDDSSTVIFEDINDLLDITPCVHTFVIIKNMFYAAKTLNDVHVGVLYDRLSNRDSSVLQSLLGRACGYSKSATTIVITSKMTVKRYFTLWTDFPEHTKGLKTGLMPALSFKTGEILSTTAFPGEPRFPLTPSL